MEKIQSMWDKMSITEKEAKKWMVENNGYLLDKEKLSLCVTMKLLSTKRSNVETFQYVLKTLGRVHVHRRMDGARDNYFFIPFKRVGVNSGCGRMGIG